jgi:hypothetical protein
MFAPAGIVHQHGNHDYHHRRDVKARVRRGGERCRSGYDTGHDPSTCGRADAQAASKSRDTHQE